MKLESSKEVTCFIPKWGCTSLIRPRLSWFPNITPYCPPSLVSSIVLSTTLFRLFPAFIFLTLSFSFYFVLLFCLPSPLVQTSRAPWIGTQYFAEWSNSQGQAYKPGETKQESCLYSAHALGSLKIQQCRAGDYVHILKGTKNASSSNVSVYIYILRFKYDGKGVGVVELQYGSSRCNVYASHCKSVFIIAVLFFLS